MDLTEKLEQLMSKRNENKMDVSRGSGVPYTTLVNFWERGSGDAKLSTLRKLANYFNCSLDYLADDSVAIEGMILTTGEMVKVPVVGRVSCGNGNLAYEDIEGYETTPKEWLTGGEHFYLRAKGDSMTGARINDGDLLLIRKQEEVENGEIAAVLIGEEAVLKKVFRHGDQMVLQSENSNYPPIFCPPDEAKIIGKLKMATIKF